MNLYMLVEGEQTEKQVYEAWFEHLFPGHDFVERPEDVESDDIYMLIGGGYPQIKDRLEAALEDIDDFGSFDHLLVCLDADENKPEVARREIEDYISRGPGPHFHDYTIVVQNPCIETWFLGNRSAFKRNPEGEFQKYVNFYDVCENDPEAMGSPESYLFTAHFHEDYLDQMFKARGLQGYSKNKPWKIKESTYLAALKTRRDQTDHLDSFGTFIDWADRRGADWP